MTVDLEGLAHAIMAARSDPETLIRAVKQYYADLPARPTALHPRPDSTKDVILVTGTTGNFGTDLLENLLRDDTVETVYALNRKGSKPLQRQQAAFRDRGFDESLLASRRFRMVEGDLDGPNLGVEPDLFEEIRSSITCIIHNAWRVNFNMPVDSFEVYLKALRSLVDLAISSPFTEPPKVQFVSSIMVFQNYEEPTPIPEERMEPSSALGCGYGESKWIGEEMLLRVAEQTSVPVQVVRLTQICGDQNFYWNEDEWFPCIVKSAALTHCLPDIDGDAAFVPNYPAARALIEMRTSPEVFMHLTHPRPPRLISLMESAAEQVGVPLVPYDQWLQALAKTGKALSAQHSRAEYAQALKQNPALPLLGFFSTWKFLPGNEMVHFIPIATDKACEASVTLEHLPELEEDIVMRWMDAWRTAGFLENH